ncbi:hypothetical protein VNI00_016090 [Paramarasmius palmivorus]|uniref:HNH nuclease domain-containing protein n=1 Tax=Paramarasmius palmivorus TaxID=297713 RepID=A0AAW0BGI1_9AGAR
MSTVRSNPDSVETLERLALANLPSTTPLKSQPAVFAEDGYNQYIAVASPCYIPGSGLAHQTSIKAHLQDDELPAAVCDVFEKDFPLPLTPYVNIPTGNRMSGLTRLEALIKLASWLPYGGRCMLTLRSACLQLAHVIPVHVQKPYIRWLEWIFGEKFRTLNINGTRNLWILDASTHYAIDRGLIKLVPTLDLLDAVGRFTEAVRKKHTGKLNNDEIGIVREEAFPRGLYKYRVVGLLCTPDFLITRHRMIQEDSSYVEEDMEIKIEPMFGAVYRTTTNPLGPRQPPAAREDLGTLGNNRDGLKISLIHQKGYRCDRSGVDVIDPTSGSTVLELPEDPLLVTVNVGDFLWAIKNRANRDRRIAAAGGDFDEWTVEDLVDNPELATPLRRCLELYETWKRDKVPRAGGRSTTQQSTRTSNREPSEADARRSDWLATKGPDVASSTAPPPVPGAPRKRGYGSKGKKGDSGSHKT